MTRRSAERILGWGLSLSFHIAAYLGATLLMFPPTHWCDVEEVRVAILRPIRAFTPVDRERDLISREAYYWAYHPWHGEPGDKEGLGSPAGFTFHGVEGRDRRRNGRSAESAILAGLRWLARHQDPQGGWVSARVSCPCGVEIEPSGEDLTALVLQAFLAAGYGAASPMVYVDPAKPDLELPFGDVVGRGLSFLSRVYGRDPTGEPGVRVPVPVDDGPILSSQLREDAGCFNGSWNPQHEGRVHVTAWNTLRLIALRNR